MAEVAEVIPSVDSVTVEQAVDAHLRDLEIRKRRPAKPSTLATFRSYRKWTRHVGHLRVADFNNANMRDFVTYLTANELAPKTIREITGLVKSSVAIVDPDTGEPVYARRAWNSRFIDAPEVRSQRQPIVTAPELEDAIEGAARAHKVLDAVLWCLAAGSGARIGELRALRIAPNDVFSYWSPDDSSLVIRTSIWRSVEVAPKTEAGHRTIEIAEPLNALLKTFVASRSAINGAFLFANKNAKPADANTLRQHLDHYLPGKGFHALRRHRATFLRSKRVPEEIIRQWLGHSGGTITDRYSKLADDVEVRRIWAAKVGLGFAPDLLTI